MTSAGSGPEISILSDQLARMRGMNAMYHRRFFSDVRYITVLVLGFLVAGWSVERWLLLFVPWIALIGAVQTSFDASYLIFARRYAAQLERRINQRMGSELLIGSRLEDDYLFPLERGAGAGFTWFGFVTVFYTLLGISAYAVGLLGGLDSLDRAYASLYLVTLVVVTGLTLGVGIWWFALGTGDRRLSAILDDSDR